jgi:hypothetical protein
VIDEIIIRIAEKIQWQHSAGVIVVMGGMCYMAKEAAKVTREYIAVRSTDRKAQSAGDGKGANHKHCPDHDAMKSALERMTAASEATLETMRGSGKSTDTGLVGQVAVINTQVTAIGNLLQGHIDQTCQRLENGRSRFDEIDRRLLRIGA